jgi:hypothetical protein
MFVASVASVVLTGAALIAVVTLGGNGDPDGPGPNPDVDACLVGEWRELSSTQRLPTGLGELVLAGEGPVFEFGEDGAGVADFGGGTVYESRSALGETVDARVSGTVRYRFVARDGTFEYLELNSQARFSIDALGFPIEDVYELSSDPLSYQCDGDTLAFSSDGYRAEYERL